MVHPDHAHPTGPVILRRCDANGTDICSSVGEPAAWEGSAPTGEVLTVGSVGMRDGADVGHRVGLALFASRWTSLQGTAHNLEAAAAAGKHLCE